MGTGVAPPKLLRHRHSISVAEGRRRGAQLLHVLPNEKMRHGRQTAKPRHKFLFQVLLE